MAAALSLALAASLEAQQPPENPSRRFGPNDCGRADPAYISNANETGGQPMFLQPSEIAKGFHFVREMTGSDREMVLWATGRLGEGSSEFVVPLDSSIKRVTFALSVDTKGGSMSVLGPSGAEIQPGGAGTEISDLNCGRIATVAAPEPGPWRVRLNGGGRFWLTGTAKSEIALVSVEFVKPGGRPGHEGLFSINGQPLAGERATLEVNLSGAVKAAEFHLVSDRGDTLAPVRMRVESSYEKSREYVGELDLPAVPFRVAVTGKDSQGHAFQRFFHTLFHAESVEIAPAGQFESIPPGRTTRVTFTVHNVGAPSTFHIIAVDGKGFVSRVEPQELPLKTGERKSVIVEMTVPLAAPIGSGDNLVITATSTSGRSTSNAAVVSLSVSDEPAR